ncbi:MAG: hypothetical protein E7425_04300 [Ruminococcaceae bacterium]|jgi:hypothetical protein|nr:hypothetical protein [Oscillospiraceae bacterium]
MDLSTIGSINQYAKGVALKTQWNLKKKSGDVTAHSKGLNDFLSASSIAAKTPEEADNEKMQKITAKVDAGAKLTEKEMEYLKEKNPQLYEKLRQIEKEQKAYEEALRHCKSKDEAQRLHMARVGEAMQAAKNGDGTAAYRMNRMTESMTAFTETDDYKKLSTEAEQALERKEQKEAEQAEQEPKISDTEKLEQTEKAEKAEDAAPSEDTEPEKVDPHAVDAVETETLAKPDVPKAESKHPSASATPHFGTQAYVTTQESEAQEKKQRKAIDVEA